MGRSTVTVGLVKGWRRGVDCNGRGGRRSTVVSGLVRGGWELSKNQVLRLRWVVTVRWMMWMGVRRRIHLEHRHEVTTHLGGPHASENYFKAGRFHVKIVGNFTSNFNTGQVKFLVELLW